VLGLDERLAELGTGGSLLVVLALAVLLGLRHATDPDHLTAVSTLVMTDRLRGTRLAGRLGLAWGLGHATTLLALGIPLIVVRRALPPDLEEAAEVLVGVVIVALAVRLLVRWRRGYLHAHAHRHGNRWHAHPHVHEAVPAHGGAPVVAHEHRHAEALGRSPAAAFAIGLLHGTGGSAGVTLLLVGAVPGRAHALVALVLFAAGTAVSMAALSAGFGRLLGRLPDRPRTTTLTPAFGVAGVLFGIWYALGALSAVPFPF
jgi:ABC-type nickel/cobalt efflux system permease component RcnA